jgi:hypothetical protein
MCCLTWSPTALVCKVIISLLIGRCIHPNNRVEKQDEWKSRWLEETVRIAFQDNPYLQNRSLVGLGRICHDSYNLDILRQLLAIIRQNLLRLENGADRNCELLISSLSCLCRILHNAPLTAEHIRSVFWLGIALLQLPHTHIFNVSLRILHIVLNLADGAGYQGAELQFVIVGDDAGLNGLSTQLQKSLGLDFRGNFSFAVAGLLIKGLNHYASRKATLQLLDAFVDRFAGGGASVEALSPSMNNLAEAATTDHYGYLFALIPKEAHDELISNSNERAELEAKRMAVQGEDWKRRLMELYRNATPDTRLLGLVFLHMILLNSEYETEIGPIHQFFSVFAKEFPQEFSIM